MDEVDLKVGERSTVALHSHGTAGYRWNSTVDDPRVARVERMPSEASPDMKPGESADERFAIVALAEGATTVHFRQTRPFGPEQAPIATYETRVRVARS